jgi:hypothetical protein
MTSIVPNRGIEVAIESVALWRPEFTLMIRGPEKPSFGSLVRGRIAGLEHRVGLVPPVPAVALVREAAAFDVGSFVLRGQSRDNQFALPNKFFE